MSISRNQRVEICDGSKDGEVTMLKIAADSVELALVFELAEDLAELRFCCWSRFWSVPNRR